METKILPVILSGVASVGTIATAILAAKETPKAIAIIDEERYVRDSADYYQGGFSQPVTKMDMLKLNWKTYLPAIVASSVTIACIFTKLGGQSK